MSDADQTIGTNRGTSESYGVTLVTKSNPLTTGTSATGASRSEFVILVLNSTYTSRGNTEAIFYGGLASATAVSYQLVEG